MNKSGVEFKEIKEFKGAAYAKRWRAARGWPPKKQPEAVKPSKKAAAKRRLPVDANGYKDDPKWPFGKQPPQSRSRLPI
jgi:hypothetical protein